MCIKDGYLRISNIIAPFTGIDQVDPEVLQRAANRGTEVHTCIEGYLMHFTPHLKPDIEPYFESFLKYWESSSHAFKGGDTILEERLYCDDFKITGKIDCIIRMADCTYLIDWKTSASYHKHWHLQGAAYKYLAQINGYDNVQDCLFVKLNKNRKPTLYKSDDFFKHFMMFQSCLEVYKFFEMEKRKR